jgi:uncharacterized membrane protein YeaQ/YmgE (transglycosylase-associated protein family)
MADTRAVVQEPESVLPADTVARIESVHDGPGPMAVLASPINDKRIRRLAPREDTSMNLIVSLIIGGIIGWLASIVMKTNAQMGMIANVIVGIVGSTIGFWLAGVLGLGANGALAQWLVSIAGAAILIALLKALNIFK